MESQELRWDALGEKYPQNLVAALKRHFVGGPFRLRARQLAIEANAPDDTADEVLESLVATGALRIKCEYICPCDRQMHLSEKEAGEETCIHCGLAFGTDVAGTPLPVKVFVHDAPETRDVRWMLALHGMNTNGAWQEDFSWLLSRIYLRSVPVAIYKYGIVRPGAVLKFRQRTLVRRLNERIRRLSQETTHSGFGGVPDVIAHSFGTWLLGHALMEDETLRVGRVILTGCILRPDFNWALLFKRKQVQAVLCHVATKDIWARVAHYLIPDSGPSGRRGFNDRSSVSHLVLSNGCHSDFFRSDLMPGLFENAWQPFLTRPAIRTEPSGDGLPRPDWRQAWWPLRATLLRIFLLTLVAGIFALGIVALAIGAVCLWKLCLR
jgi:hypothetical protein